MTSTLTAEQLHPTLWRLPVPDNFNTTIAYLVTGQNLVALIDPGHGSLPAHQALVAGLEVAGYTPDQVDLILYTHPHTDHMGGGALWEQFFPGQVRHLALAGLEHTGAIYPEYVRATHHQSARKMAGLCPEFARLLLSPECARWIQEYFVAPGSLALHPLQPGQLIDLGGTELLAFHTPGHEPSHLAYLHLPSRGLISGDLLLGSSTSLEPFTGGDAAAYFLGLDNAEAANAELVFPAHGDPRPAQITIDKARATTRAHSATILQMLAAGPQTIYQLYQQLFKEPVEDPTIILYLGLILSHLTALENQGRVQRIEVQPPSWQVRACIP